MEGLKSRAVALIICAALIVAGWFGLGSFLKNSDSSNSGLAAYVDGVNGDTIVMTIGTSDVTANEYLYWLTSGCDYLSQYYGVTDWNTEVTTDLTAADYVKEESDYYMAQYVAIEQMAAEQGVALTQEQQLALDNLHEENITAYGDEETYHYYMQYAGMTDEMMTRFSTDSYLYSNLCDQLLADDGELAPTEERLADFAERNAYTDVDDETLLGYYMDTGYGAVYEYMDDYINSLEITHTEAYDKIDINAFYENLTAARNALEQEYSASHDEASTQE